MGDEVNPCVARRGRPCWRSKGVSVAYGLADATAAPVNSDYFSGTGLPE